MERNTRFAAWIQAPLALVLMALADKPLAASEEAPPPELDRFKVGGLIFGDAYWVASYHQPESEGTVSAWIRRGYLTFDSELTRTWRGRMRFELNQAGEFDVFKFDFRFKDLYLQKTIGEHRVLFGLAPTPTFNLIEKIWGYRHIERTPLDLQGIASRDTGIFVYLGVAERAASTTSVYCALVAVDPAAAPDDADDLVAGGLLFQPLDTSQNVNIRQE